MRGSHLHNHILLDPIERMLTAEQWTTTREYAVSLIDGAAGAIDLFAERFEIRVAIEVELSADRVIKDVEKAIAARATTLIIVTPRSSIRQAARRKLRSVPDLAVGCFVLTQPQALQQLARGFSFPSTLIPTGNTTQQRFRRSNRP